MPPSPSTGPGRDARGWEWLAAARDRFTAAASAPGYATVRLLLAQDLDGADQVLDARTGTGDLAVLAADLGAQVTACDSDPATIDTARRRAPATGAYPIRWDLGDVTALPYPDGRFDAAILSDLLHLVPDPGRVLAEAQRVLRPGGTLVAPTYCWGAGPSARLRRLLFRPLGIRVRTPWTVAGYRSFLESAGLVVRRFEVLAARPPLVYAALIAPDPTRSR